MEKKYQFYTSNLLLVQYLECVEILLYIMLVLLKSVLLKNVKWA